MWGTFLKAEVITAEKWATLYTYLQSNGHLHMLKRPGFNNEKFKRVHRKELRFNSFELEAINSYCDRYKIKNRSKFLREAIISKILYQFEQDHPKLF